MGKTVKTLCKEYLEHKRYLVKDSTYANYEGKIYTHIIPALGDIDASKVTRKQAENFINGLYNKGLSKNYIHDIGTLMRQIYNYAANRNENIENVFSKVTLPKAEHKKIRVLSDVDAGKVMKYGDTAIKIALSMGLRVGEISGIMGKDAKNGILTISRTIRRIPVRGQGTKLTISSPKTSDSKRQIPIPENIAYLFDVPDNEYVIGGSKFVEPRVIMYHWKSFCNEQNIEYINFHGLRHTFATKALEKGVDVKTLSEILGHASVDITMNLYCHPSMNHKAEVMKRIWE